MAGKAALRSAGLPERLTGSGLEIHDDGDLPHQVWSPDRDHPLAQNAGKRSITLNLKCAAGKEVFEKLVATADVVVENFRVGRLAEFGLEFTR